MNDAASGLALLFQMWLPALAVVICLLAMDSQPRTRSPRGQVIVDDTPPRPKDPPDPNQPRPPVVVQDLPD